MATIDVMLKKIILAGRDEGFMSAGDDISATNEILVIFSGNEQVYEQEEDQEVDDENNEIYELYIHVDALKDDFQYPEIDDFLDIEISIKGMIHIRAVYEVDKDYLHMNQLDDYVSSATGVTIAKINKVIKAAYENVTDD